MLYDRVRVNASSIEGAVIRRTDCIDLSRGDALDGNNEDEKDGRQDEEAFDAACL